MRDREEEGGREIKGRATRLMNELIVKKWSCPVRDPAGVLAPNNPFGIPQIQRSRGPRDNQIH